MPPQDAGKRLRVGLRNLTPWEGACCRCCPAVANKGEKDENNCVVGSSTVDNSANDDSANDSRSRRQRNRKLHRCFDSRGHRRDNQPADSHHKHSGSRHDRHRSALGTRTTPRIFRVPPCNRRSPSSVNYPRHRPASPRLRLGGAGTATHRRTPTTAPSNSPPFFYGGGSRLKNGGALWIMPGGRPPLAVTVPRNKVG
jgi:hypothetical protein